MELLSIILVINYYYVLRNNDYGFNEIVRKFGILLKSLL